MTNIFNTTKTTEEYQKTNLFFGGEPGLIDTIHKSYPEIWSLYKEMKSLDWSEDEVNFAKCFSDFKSVDSDISDMMLETIMWQWSADSIASQFPLVIISPFQPCMEIVEAEQAIQTNELVHANTYSEIIRISFDNPREVLDKMLANGETFDRLHLVGTALRSMQEFSVRYNYAQMFDTDQLKTNPEFAEKEVVARLIEYYFIMLLLERIQFMASFAITFTICKSGVFSGIGQAVKKIAQDELEVHAEYRKEVIKELRTKYPEVYEKVKPTLLSLFNEVIESEMSWTESLFDGRTLIGTNVDLIKEWVLFNAKDVSRFAGFSKDDIKYSFPRSNPMPFLEDWFNMNLQQSAPQEIEITAYKMNVVSRDDEDEEFDF